MLADLLLLILIASSLWYGWRKGFIDSFIDISIWFGSLLIALIAAEYTIRLLNYLNITSNWVRPAYFIILLAGFSRLIFVQTDRISASFSAELHSHWANRTAGLLPGLFSGILFATLSGMFLLTYQVGALSRSASSGKLVNFLADKQTAPGKHITGILNQIGYKLGNTVTIHPENGETIRLPFRTAQFILRSDLEIVLLDMINAERKAAGLLPLSEDERLRSLAREHSADMLQKGYFSHQSPNGMGTFDRLRKKGIFYSLAGENLGLARTAELVHDGFMTSHVHKANILNPAFGSVGIGVNDAGSHGLMVTQIFKN